MELITCVCLTMASRKDFLLRAADCFDRQTYPNRELIIVADEALTVGEKRNMGCQRARGSLIAIWDDDDVSGPHRLEIQEHLLRISGKSVTAFKQLPFAQNGEWWMSPATDKEGVDTSLFFRRDFWETHPFQEIMIGQDAAFSRQAIVEKKFLLTEECGVMFAENHPGNTCDRTVLAPGWTKLPNFKWQDSHV